MPFTLRQRKHLGVLIAVASAVIFGAWPAAARAVYAEGGNTVFMIMLTTAFRAASLILFCAALRKPLFADRRHIRPALTGGFFQALSITCVFASLLYLPGPVAIIILFTHTLMLLFFMAWRGETCLDGLTLLTTLGALGGLSLVVDVWHPQRISLIGLGLALAAAIATMSRVYVYGHQTQTRSPAVVGAEAFSFAALFLLALPLFALPQLPASPAGYAWALLGSLSLSAGTFGMFYGIALLGAFQYSLLVKLEPVFTALFSVLFINEVLRWPQYAGMLIVIGSLAAYQYGSAKRQRIAALALEKA